jgi:hypothetical protein
MSFFKKILGGKVKQPKEDNDASPTTPLNLQFLTIPANGIKFAQQFIDAANKIENRSWIIQLSQ